MSPQRLDFSTVRSTLFGDLGRITWLPRDVKKCIGDSSLCGHIGPGVRPSGVSDWLRVSHRERVSVPHDIIQNSTISLLSIALFRLLGY